MKPFFGRRLLIVAATVVVLIGGGLVLYFNRSSAVRAAVEKDLAAALQGPATIERARLGLLGGVSLSKVELGARGAKSKDMLTIDKVHAAVSFGQFSGDPIQIDTLTLTRPAVSVDVRRAWVNFYDTLRVRPKPFPGDKPSDGKRQDGEPMRFKVAKVIIKDASVTFDKSVPGMRKEMEVEIPRIEFSTLSAGGADANGITANDLVGRIMTVMVAKALDDSKIASGPKRQLAQWVSDVGNFVGGDFKNEIDSACKPIASMSKDVAPRGAQPDLDKGFNPNDLDLPK